MISFSCTKKHRPHHTAVALGMAAAVVALAIGGATGHQSGATLLLPQAPITSPSVGGNPAIAPSAPRSQPPSAPPGPTATSYPSRPTVPPAPTTSPSLTAQSEPTTSPDLTAPSVTPALDPPPKPGRFAIDLFEEGDFASQARFDWCVPASILMMTNMIDVAADEALPTQGALDRLARSLSTERLRGAGSEPEGWAGSLNELGYGPYEVRAERTRTAAIEVAARAIRTTGRPVGLLVWRGAHAWVMTGFRATADPAYTDDFAVTDVYVADPWHPRVSSIWGPAQPPNTLIPVRRMAEDYLAWRRPAVRYPEKDGRFVLVVPVAEGPSAS
jgi:hypothetical protein